MSSLSLAVDAALDAFQLPDTFVCRDSHPPLPEGAQCAGKDHRLVRVVAIKKYIVAHREDQQKFPKLFAKQTCELNVLEQLRKIILCDIVGPAIASNAVTIYSGGAVVVNT